MRAISIMLSAFGPYKDEQVIDFRELGDESIFLVTGPTGAGKTTIFDAICFALYGKASGSERDHDTFRSHFAEQNDKTAVSFTFQLKDTTYLIYRQPRQLKPKERGEGFREEPALAELYQVDNGEKHLIHSKIKDVNEKIEQMLGLDYDQFRKMIMIPQGEFRKLIAENSKEREEILQKIFRTYFYQDMTEALKTQTKKIKEQLQQTDWKVKQEISKIDWDDPTLVDTTAINSVLDALDHKLKNDQEKRKELTKKVTKEKQQLQSSQEAFYKGKQLADKFKEQEQLLKEKEKLDNRKIEIESTVTVLKWGEKANQLLPFEKQANDRLNEWQKQVNMLEEQKQTVAILEKEFKRLSENYQVQQAKEKEKQEEKLQLVEKKKQLEKLRHYTEISTNLEKTKNQYQEKDRIVKSINKDLEEKKTNLQAVEHLLSKQTEQTKAYYETEKELLYAEERYKKSLTLINEYHELEKLRKDYQQVKDHYVQVNQQLKEKRHAVQKIEEQQQTHHAYVLASHLHDGEACPVCGSETHPAKAEIETTAISEKAYKQEKTELQELEAAITKWQDKYIEAKSKGEAKRDVVENMAKEYQTIETLDRTNIEKLTYRCKEEKNLKQKVFNEIKEQYNKIEKAEAEKQKLTNETTKLTEQYEIQKTGLDKLKNEQVTLEAQLVQLRADIPEQPMTVEKWQEHIQKTEQALDNWFHMWQEQQEAWEESKQKLQESKTTFTSLEKFVTDLAEKKKQQESLFNQKVKEAGFTTIATFQEAKISEKQLEIMKHEIEQYNQSVQSVTERLQTLSEQLEGQVKPDLDLLQESINFYSNQLDSTNQSLHAISLQIKQHKQFQSNIKELAEEQEKHDKEYYDIAELADLARGDNHLKLSFERYVLSSFLEEILLQANIRMDQLTEHRYQLIRSNQVAKRGAQSGLDLEVMDQHTGQQRSVKTLSGGEGFKAALSLALGMADVVQAHAGGVQLETLFIDEGFGTLDELSLEQAIDCLKGLQQSNRILGIISHVPQLKEEIYAKLQIKPTPQGSFARFTF
ncbi:nuclease SbcCD subunit C [Paraliobacillus quinghaiensis]|uniref:Nuclease SbcCD subunit C n=1 Tax=Paraliobacillus quinghaiensis TaxID=470815 RepID=A0A917TI63_9BACI|nr:AAA family ATPase [Paraliobacillus quinghaiensis]GGM23310.1 nuclease SbcCD subunit C [Paraliobacillus quinghaiensis]